MFEWFVGLRYLRIKRSSKAVALISIIPVACIALGVAALIIVLSVMNGFQTEIRQRILGAASHIEVTHFDGTLPNWQAVQTLVKKEAPEVIASAPFVQGQALLSANGVAEGAMIRGVDPAQENTVVEFSKHMQSGEMNALKQGEFGIVVGSGYAKKMGLSVGDKVTLITPDGNMSPAGVAPRMKRFTVVGVFHLDMVQIDSMLAMIQIQDAQKLFRMGQDVSGVRLKLNHLDLAPQVSAQLNPKLNDLEAYATNWTQLFSGYFQALKMEKIMIGIFLTLIILVASFNLVSTLIMTVNDKRADIAIMRTMGASPASIMRIFMLQGFLVGIIGAALGITLGVSVALNIDVIVPALMSALGMGESLNEVYLISKLPSELHWYDVGLITGIALILSLLATIIPSISAAQTNPAQALRYE